MTLSREVFMRYSMWKNIAAVKSQSRTNQGHWKWSIQLTGYGFLLAFYRTFVPKFLRYSILNVPRPWKQIRGPSRSLKMSPFDRTHDFSLTFHSNHGPISYRFRDDGDFSLKLKFFHPIIFCAPAEGVPFGVRDRRWGSENKNDGATGPTKKKRYLQPSGCNASTWQTDGQWVDLWTDTGPQRPRLRIASRGKDLSVLAWLGTRGLF